MIDMYFELIVCLLGCLDIISAFYVFLLLSYLLILKPAMMTL